MKTYTDIDQSKKLIELGIDINSADMWYQHIGWKHLADNSEVPTYFPMVIRDCESEDDIPCWSLAALLSVLPTYLFEFDRGIDLNVYPNLNGIRWHCSYMPNCIENMKTDKFKLITSGDTLVDACYEMILKLHELKLL